MIYSSDRESFFETGGFFRGIHNRKALKKTGDMYYSDNKAVGFQSGNTVYKMDKPGSAIRVIGDNFYTNKATYFLCGNTLRSTTGKTWWNVNSKDEAMNCIIMEEM